MIDNNSELKCKYNGKETNIDKNDSKIKLTGTGIQTLEFLYTFYDIKTNKNITVSSFIEIFVGKSELSSISATWNGNGYPLGVTPDNSNSAYGTWKISLKFVNGITKSVESGKCSFEYKAGEIEKIKDAVLNGSTKNCPVIVKYADKQTEVNVMVKCPDVLGITAKLNGNNNKFRKGDTKLREYITANKILQFISDTPKIAANDISVDMIEINGSSESNGLLKVEYSNSGKTFSDFIDVKIIDPRINLASNNISVSLINNCDFSALTDNLKIYESGSDIKKKLELLTEEKYSITEKKWKLYISARQKIEAYGDTEQYSTIKSLECSYSYTEQGQNFNINNIKVSREYKIDDKIIKKQLTKDTDFFVYTDNYTVQDEYGNKITEYTKPQQPQGGN